MLNGNHKTKADLIAELESLRQSHAMLAAAYQFTPVGMVLFRLEDTRIVDINPAGLDIIGQPHQEVIGKTALEVGVIGLPLQRANPFLQIEQLPTLRNIETTVHLKDGATRTWLNSYEVLTLNDQNFLLQSIEDITERRREKAICQQSAATAQVLLNTPVDGVMLLDKNGAILEINETGAQRLGKTPTEILGENLYKLLPEDLASGVKGYFNKAIVTRVPLRFEYESQARYIDWVVVPILDRDGVVEKVVVWGRDITERKQSEAQREAALEAMHASEERFRQVLENSLDAAYRRDLQAHTYEYFSPVIQRISGFSFDELKAMSTESVLAHIHPADRVQVEKVMADAAQNPGQAYILEYRFQHKDGQYRWFQDQFTDILNIRSQPVYRYGSVRDITERKQAETALAASQASLRRFFDQGPLMMGVSELDHGRIIMICANAAVGSFMGYSAEELTEKPLNQLNVDEQVAHLLVEQYQRCLEEGKTIDFEYERPHPKGKRWVHSTVANFGKGPSGRPRFSFVSEDITERKQMEQELEQVRLHLEEVVMARTATLREEVAQHLRTQQALQESELRLRLTLEAANIVAWEVNPVSGEHHEAGRVDALFGRQVGFYHPTLNDLIESIHPQDRERVRAAIAAAVRGEIEYEIDYRVELPDGSLRWISANGTLLRDAAGQPARLLGIARDITRSKQAEAALQRSLEEKELLIKERQLWAGK